MTHIYDLIKGKKPICEGGDEMDTKMLDQQNEENGESKDKKVLIHSWNTIIFPLEISHD